MIAYNNNNMRNPLPTSLLWVTHVIIVVCYHPLPCCICTAPCLYDFWHCHPYIVQHVYENVFTLVRTCSRLVLSQSGISSALSLVSTIASVPAIITMHTHFVYVQANSKISQMNGNNCYTHSGVW